MRLALPLALLALFAAACATADSTAPGDVPEWARARTEAPDEFILYALHPSNFFSRDQAELEALPRFHGYPILGEVLLTDVPAREELVRLLWQTIDSDDGTRAHCFNPRHGIRATQDGMSADWVICFECLSMHVIDDAGTQVNLGGPSDVEPAFSSIYMDAGLQLDGQ